MAKSLMNKAKNLKQVDETWEVAVRPARTWVESRGGEPYRPWQVFVVSKNDRIVRHDMYPKKPTAFEVAETLFKAMLRPAFGAGSKRRPSIIVVDDEKLLEDLATKLSEINIESKKSPSLPYLNAIQKEMNSMLNKDEEMGSLLSIPGVTIPLLTKVFEASAAYYRLAPWKMLREDEFAIEVRYPADGEARYAVVIGRAGESFGLSVNDTLDDLYQMIENTQTGKMRSGNYSVLSCAYESPYYLAFDDLDAIEKYGWEIPNEKAYPSITRYSPKTDLQPPTKEDIFWLEAVLPVLTEFFKNHFNAEEFFRDFGKVEFEYTATVKTLRGKESVLITLPIEIY